MGKDSRRKWVAAEVEDGVHALLWEYSTELGEHPSRVIERFIIDGLERVADEMENPGMDFRAFAAVRGAIRREQSRTRLERLAWSAQQHGDERAFDDLQSLCEDYDLTVEEVMDAVKGQEQAPIVIQDDGRGISSAMAWLTGMFQSKDEYPANVIFSLGEGQGFSKPTLNAAKRKLNLVSIRRPRHWAWALSVDRAAAPNNGSGKPVQEPNPRTAAEPF